MAIAKTASRNVAFKVAKMRDSIMEDQDDLIICKSECDELGSEVNAKVRSCRMTLLFRLLGPQALIPQRRPDYTRHWLVV